MTKGLVSFVVLNWNGLDDTLLCLESIRKQTIPACEIIVVDNGSSNDQKTVLRGIEDIVFVDLPQNTGFTGGQIAALKEAKGEFLALINNDAVLAPNWAKEALSSFASNPGCAAVGGRAYVWQEDNGHKPYATKNPFYSYQVVNLTTGHTRTLTYGEKEVPVDSISGAGVMISRKAIDKVGYFDNRFFAYYEETDLFARFKRAGMQIIYNPSMHVWHKIAQSTRSKPDFYLYHMHRNRFIFAVKNYDGKYLLKFFRSYTREWVGACLSVIKNGAKNRIEQKNIIKAGLWNLLHLPRTLSQRSSVQRLGSAYSEALLRDSAESIAVVIPCYNYAQYVGEAIESALAQSWAADQIIVINDGSTDNSLEVINHYKDRVRIVNQKNNGIIQTKNRALELATADWIIFLDADDKMDKRYIEKLYTEARKTNADIVYSGMEFIGYEDGIFWSRPFGRRAIRKGNYINNSALMRRDMLFALGGYNEKMSFGYEDWELYVNLAEHNAKFRYVRAPLLFYRRHASDSRDKAAQKKLQNAHILVRQLHPRLYSRKYELIDFAHTVLLFGQRRTPLQIVRDIRYLIVKKLDNVSQHSTALNKVLGASRLLASGNISSFKDKIKLNATRAKKRFSK